jgi:hypothetical protein
MAKSFISSPDTTANTGPKRRTNKRTMTGTIEGVATPDLHESHVLIQDPVGEDVQARVLDAAPAGTEAGVVTRPIISALPALPAGDNNIGNVDIVTMPAVALDSATLTALENITVGGEVSLSAGSLSALENVTVGGEIELGPTSLAALESITASGPLTDTQLRATPLSMLGDVAHDAADSGSPIKIGGKAFTSTPTPVADADRVNAQFDEYGRQVVSDRDPETGMSVGTTGLRDRLFAQRYTVLSDSLADGLAPFWTSAVANGGTATSTGGEGVIQTSAAATGSAQITSTTVPYHPGQVAWMNSAARFNDTGSAGNIRRIGLFTVSGTTPQEGAYYELSGTTLNAVIVKGGVATAVASTSWSRFAIAPFTLDTNFHFYEIRFTGNTIWFYIDNVLRHVVTGTTATLTTTLNFPITISSVNTSGATNRTISVRNIGYGRFGTPASQIVQRVEEVRYTYSAANAAYTPPATPTDLVNLIGSATKLIRVSRVEIYATQTTAATQSFHLIRRTAANTAGTRVTATPGTYATANPAVTATYGHHTANPSALGAGTTLRTWRDLVPAPATARQGVPLVSWVFENGQPILSGVAESLAVNFAGAALPAGLTIVVVMEWTEE